jgi:hypothetical protein
LIARTATRRPRLPRNAFKSNNRIPHRGSTGRQRDWTPENDESAGPEGPALQLVEGGVRSDRQDALGVVAQTGDGPRDETAGGFGGDAEALADLTEALALTVDEAEASFDGVAGP